MSDSKFASVSIKVGGKGKKGHKVTLTAGDVTKSTHVGGKRLAADIQRSVRQWVGAAEKVHVTMGGKRRTFVSDGDGGAKAISTVAVTRKGNTDASHKPANTSHKPANKNASAKGGKRKVSAKAKAGLARYQKWAAEYREKHPGVKRAALATAWKKHNGVSNTSAATSTKAAPKAKAKAKAKNTNASAKPAANTSSKGKGKREVSPKAKAGLARYQKWAKAYRAKHPGVKRDALAAAWKKHEAGGSTTTTTNASAKPAAKKTGKKAAAKNTNASAKPAANTSKKNANASSKGKGKREVSAKAAAAFGKYQEWAKAYRAKHPGINAQDLAAAWHKHKGTTPAAKKEGKGSKGKAAGKSGGKKASGKTASSGASSLLPNPAETLSSAAMKKAKRRR